MITSPDEMLKQLDVLPVSELLSHEQTVPPNIKRLKEAMLNLGQLVDPIIIDGNSKTVLDGNHRLKVLKVIECPYAACQVVDYVNPKIKVGTWYIDIETEPESLMKKDSVRMEVVDFETGLESLKNMKSPFMIVSKKNGNYESKLCEPGAYKLEELIEEQNYVLSSMKENGYKYIGDDLAKEYLDRGHTILFRRSYTKEEIIRFAKNHNPLPPKSTRHEIPDRIIRLNMRLGWLHEGRDEAMRHLKDMLEHRVYAGNVRRYSEPVIVVY